MTMTAIRTALLGSALLLVAPAAASAQGYLTAFVGGNFGGSSGVSLDQSINDTSNLDFGARLGAGGGIFGGEIDVGYTPDFYGKGTIFDSSSVLTVMGNVVLGIPAGPVRPYMAAGIGLIRRTVTYVPGEGQGSVTDSRAAYSIGGGVNFFVSQHVGIDADFRYFRNFSAGNALLDLSNEKFNFGRGSVGITFRF
jgi:opacity protein-like surface antigen